jgi:hypothetical protein
MPYKIPQVRKTFRIDGKRYYANGATEAEAIAKMALMKRDIEEKRVIPEPAMTVAKWAPHWLETYKRPPVDESTAKDYESRLKNHVLPKIGYMKLKDVKLSHLPAHLRDGRRDGGDGAGKNQNRKSLEIVEISRLLSW